MKKKTVLLLLTCLVVVGVAGFVFYEYSQYKKNQKKLEVVRGLEDVNNEWKGVLDTLSVYESEMNAHEYYSRAEYKSIYSRYKMNLREKFDKICGKNFFGIKLGKGMRDFAYENFYSYYEENNFSKPEDIVNSEVVSEDMKRVVKEELELREAVGNKLSEMEQIPKKRIID